MEACGDILDLNLNTALQGQEDTALVMPSLFLRQIKGSLTEPLHDDDERPKHRLISHGSKAFIPNYN